MASNAFLSRFGNRMSVVGRDGTVTRIPSESTDEASPATRRGRTDSKPTPSYAGQPPSSGSAAAPSAQPPLWGQQATISLPAQASRAQPATSLVQPPQPQRVASPYVPSYASAAAPQYEPPEGTQPTTKQVSRRPTAAELSALAKQESVLFGLPQGSGPRLSPRAPPQQQPRFPPAELAIPPQPPSPCAPSPCAPPQFTAPVRPHQPPPPAGTASLLFPYANASAALEVQRQDGRRSSVPSLAGEGVPSAAGGSLGISERRAVANTCSASPGLVNHPPPRRLSAASSTLQYGPPSAAGAGAAAGQAWQPPNPGEQDPAAPPPAWAHAQWMQNAQWAQAQQAHWAQHMQQAQWMAQQQMHWQQQQQQQQSGWVQPHRCFGLPQHETSARGSEGSERDESPACGQGAGPAVKMGSGRRAVNAQHASEPPQREQSTGGGNGGGKGRPRTGPAADSRARADRMDLTEGASGVHEGRSVSASSRRRPAAPAPPRDTMSAGESNGSASSPSKSTENLPGYMRKGEERRQYTGTYKRYTGKVSTEYTVMGKLKPDLNTEELLEKRAKAERVKLFSKNLRMINREEAAMSAKPAETGPAPPLWKPQPKAEPSRVDVAKEYAKRVPRPRPRPTANPEPDEATQEKEEDVDPILLLERQHEEQVKQAAQIRAELGL